MGEGRSTKHITSRSPATSPPTYYLARNAAANHRHGWIWTAELVAIYLQLFSRVVTQDECHNKCDALHEDPFPVIDVVTRHRAPQPIFGSFRLLMSCKTERNEQAG